MVYKGDKSHQETMANIRQNEHDSGVDKKSEKAKTLQL